MMHRVILFVLALGLLTQLACQSSSGEVAAPSATPSPVAATPAVVAAPGEIKTAPSGLKYQDLILGTGRRPMIGQTVVVNYVGKLENGKVFEQGKINFKLGEKDMLLGFTQGIAGGEGIDAMKVDGKRLVILTPELAYGKTGNPPKVPANATISFEIELLKIQGGGLGF